MNRAIGSAFELSLRIMLMLGELTNRALSADMIAALDVVIVYAHDFGASENNLHGYGNFRFAEYPARRALAAIGLKKLVADGFVSVDITSDGFGYKLTDNGVVHAEGLECAYADEYRDTLWRVMELYGGRNEAEIIRMINAKTTFRRINNG